MANETCYTVADQINTCMYCHFSTVLMWPLPFLMCMHVHVCQLINKGNIFVNEHSI